MRRTWRAVLVLCALTLLPEYAVAQGPRVGGLPRPWIPVTFATGSIGHSMPGAQLAQPRLSGGGRGALIGMAIGAAAGAGFALAACGPQLDFPCAPVVAVSGAVGLALGALVGYSIGREDWD